MVRIGKIGDFELGRWRTFRLLARPVGVLRVEDQIFRAMEMTCKHAGADLSDGRRKGDILTCPWHGWQYDINTGECIWGAPVSLRPHACEVRGDDVYVSLRPAAEGAE